MYNIQTGDERILYFFFSSRRRHTRFKCDWSSDVCSSDLMSFRVPVTVYHDAMDELSDVPDLQKNLIWELNVFVTDLDEKVSSLLHTDRSKSGIVVVAQGGGPNAVDTGLQPGAIIRALAHTPLQSVSQLRETLRTFKSGDPVVVQVERDGKLQYLAFEME